MNCALKTLIDKREAITDKICGLKLEIESYERSNPTDEDGTEYIKMARVYISNSRINLLDLRNAIRLIENGAMCNE